MYTEQIKRVSEYIYISICAIGLKTFLLEDNMLNVEKHDICLFLAPLIGTQVYLSSVGHRHWIPLNILPSCINLVSSNMAMELGDVSQIVVIA